MLIIFYPRLYYLLLAGNTISYFLNKNTEFKNITDFIKSIPSNDYTCEYILEILKKF